MAKPEAPVSPYEELRRQKLEENKKKLSELNLSHLSQTLRAATSPKPSLTKRPVKRRLQEFGFHVVRRSNRVAKLPTADYKEASLVTDFDERSPRRIYCKRRYSSHRDLDGRVYASDEARSYAITRAEEVQSQLDPNIPSFVKPMTQSHVTGGFWLGLTKHFCTQYLPSLDSDITLIDEDGEEFETLWLAKKTGLSAGWRGFSIAHELVDGDALVFQLVEPTTFKVYIIRASEYESS